ncbi:putative phosphoglycerate mutase pmu1 [Maublancomyces gigas]|uniref:Phosphoglycerate mutase pmu1 n=1 Tax=Discina gigas TaxID=1032678 RepID=A0ABR3GTN7_9PEZI
MVVIFSSLVALFVAAFIVDTAGAGVQRWKSVKKTTVVGFFAQDLAETNETTFDYLTFREITSNFGLLDKFRVPGLEERNDRDHAPWKKFKEAIEKLNKKSPKNTAYKVLYLARHGEGYHNVAESFYGTPLWDCYWSLLDGNGTSRWDDAELTPKGIEEAKKASAAFKDQVKAKFPLPDIYYSSPLSRAASTLEITWGNITLSGHNAAKPIFKEPLQGFRETIGIHTCDRRNTKTWLHKKYPSFTFEGDFVEVDKLWDPAWREPNEVRNRRASDALNEIFADTSDTFISITAHSGAITR